MWYSELKKICFREKSLDYDWEVIIGSHICSDDHINDDINLISVYSFQDICISQNVCVCVCVSVIDMQCILGIKFYLLFMSVFHFIVH